ncbi:MAG: hypothetical protein M3Y35_00040, partial [Actinomycetota bacterium]|nr:hypothetical protein [Actinomycetota bacterium]
PDVDNRHPNPSDDARRKSNYDDRWMDRSRCPGFSHGLFRRQGRHSVTAFDIDPQKAVALAGDGVKAAATVSDAAAKEDGLVLMVATERRSNRCPTGTARLRQHSGRVA